MLEGKARVEDTDMPARMQAAATTAASRALDLFDVADCRGIAGHIKTARPLSFPLAAVLVSLTFDLMDGNGIMIHGS